MTIVVEDIIAEIQLPALRKYAQFIYHKKFKNLENDYPVEFKVLTDMINEVIDEYSKQRSKSIYFDSEVTRLEQMLEDSRNEIQVKFRDFAQDMIQKQQQEEAKKKNAAQ